MLAFIFSTFSKHTPHILRHPYGQNRTHHKASRERFLLPDEWRRVRAVLLLCPLKVRNFFTLLLLTGCRVGELLAMEWEHLDLEFCIWHKPRTKTGRSHTVSLSPQACTFLGEIPRLGRYVFTGDPDHNGSKPDQPWSKTAVNYWWHKIRKAAGIPDVWIHDIRRTLGAWMTMHRENLHIVQTIFNHSDIRVTAKTYSPFALDTQREALIRHADRVLA